MPYLGEALSLATAVVWAFAVILLRRSGETMPPFDLNLFRVGLSTPLLLVTLALAGGPFLPDRPWGDYALLTLSAVLGVAVSDTLFHRSLNLVGAGISAIVDSVYSPLVALAAFLALGERIGAPQLAGMALVVGAVVVASQATPPAGATRRDLVVGTLWGLAAMATLAAGLVAAKPVLGRASLLWVVTFRQLVSLVALLAVAAASGRRGELLALFRPRADWRYTVPGTLLGSYLALVLWLAGMKHAATGVSAILNQTSTVIVLVLASLFLGEPFTGRRWVAATLAVGGILLVTFG